MGNNNENQKMPVFEWDMVTPEICYTKGNYGRVAKAYAKFYYVSCAVLIAEALLSLGLGDSICKLAGAIIFLAVVLLFVNAFVITPKKRKKQYEKVVASLEDHWHHTFYDDCVVVKNATLEATLNYSDVEYMVENHQVLVLVFPFQRQVIVDKSMAEEDKLQFIRDKVSPDQMDAAEKKMIKRCVPRAIGMVVLLIGLFLILLGTGIKEASYPKNYQRMAYGIFVDCVKDGTVKDVELRGGNVIVYTYHGDDGDVTYYTELGESKEALMELLDETGTLWKEK